MKLAVFDLDGVLSKGKVFSKDLSKDMLEGERENLKNFKDYMSQKNVPCVAVTGRSLEISKELMTYMDDFSVCEHGTIVVDPKTMDWYHLVDGEDKFSNLIEAKDRLESFIHLAEKFDEILLNAFPEEKIKRRDDNLHILTYEFESVEGEDFAMRLYTELYKHLPHEIKLDLNNKDIVLKTCDMAIDLMPGVSKKEGLIHLLNKLNIDTKDVIIFGDSYHSDGQMMKVITDGVWVCPGNSDDRLKEEIKNRGKLGYVAEKPFFEGTMDAIHHFFD
jgi:HAD superfamily hydrolase (TIGR01484 family)